MFVMICYDVPSERTEKYKKLLRRFLHHHQNSVFMGDLPLSSHLKMRKEIAKIFENGDHLVEMSAENRHNITLNNLGKNEKGLLMEQPDRRHTENAYVL